MQTKIIEVTNAEEGGGINYGKFLIGRLDVEWERPQLVYAKEEIEARTSGARAVSLLRAIGTNPDCLWVFDLQTCEGASFRPGGLASADLAKHKIWVCPMFEPFLNWLYKQNCSDLEKLPALVKFTEAEAPSAMAGYRRAGEGSTERETIPEGLQGSDEEIEFLLKVLEDAPNHAERSDPGIYKPKDEALIKRLYNTVKSWRKKP